MYYIEQDNKIVLFNADRQRLENVLQFTPQYQDLPIKETEEGYTIVDFKLITIEEYNEMELNKAKQAKVKENDIARDAALNAGVTYKNVLFDSDTDQKINLLATVGRMSDEDTTIWFGMNNEPLECNKEDLFNIGGLITQLDTFCWTKNAEIKAEIAEASTFEELEAIEISYEIPDEEDLESEAS